MSERIQFLGAAFTTGYEWMREKLSARGRDDVRFLFRYGSAIVEPSGVGRKSSAIKGERPSIRW